jgi:hypothetical protein
VYERGNHLLVHPTLNLGTKEGALGVRRFTYIKFLTLDMFLTNGGATSLGGKVS